MSENVEHLETGPAWASALGVVAIVLGVLLVAAHGNEWVTQYTIPAVGETVSEMPPADCPQDELEEEGLTVAQCEQMVSNLQSIRVSRPDWFRSSQLVVSAVGTGLAFVSILVGAALVNYRRWAAGAAVLVFGALVAVDVVTFITAVQTGPILRAMYLWDALLWFCLHLMMMLGAIVGAQHEQTA